MLRKFLILIPFIILTAVSVSGQRYYNVRKEVINGDSAIVADLAPFYKFSRPIDLRKYERLVRNVKKVYPIAQFANAKLKEIEDNMATLNKRHQQAYIKQVEKELKKEFTPILKNMSYAQGKVLIKLIDRETTNTTYEIVKDLRGNFSAFMWQTVARVFTANLKDEYDKTGEDRIIEQIIILYEAGVI